jgi:hypothetical protein
MKYIILCISIVMLTLSSANAQTQINPVIGMNFSTLANTPDELQTEARLGWHFGVNMRIGDRFYFQPGVHYAQLNSELTSVEDGQSVTDTSFKSNIGVLRIPLLAGLRIFSNEDKEALFNVNIHAGIATELVMAVDEDKTGLTKDDFTSPIFAAVFGAGIDFLFLTFDIDYELGLTPVFDSERINLSTEPKSNALLITIGGKFQL